MGVSSSMGHRAAKLVYIYIERRTFEGKEGLLATSLSR